MSLAGIRQLAFPLRLLQRPAPTETRQAAHGDELRDLAETFGRTVERLSSLVHQLEDAHARALQAEVEKKQFYREVIRAVTQGKFELVDETALPEVPADAAEVSVTDGAGYASARRLIAEAAANAGMEDDRAGELVLAAGEAITNAMKHARGGCCRVFAGEGTVCVRITDEGSGIRSEDLPAAILMPGFSTKVSLGMGYTMMLRLCDRVWLSTGPQGTVIQLEKSVVPPPENRFPNLGL